MRRGVIEQWLIGGALAMVLLLTLAVLVSRAAHGAPPPPGSEDEELLGPFAQWVHDQRDATGMWCCDIADGRVVQVRVRDGRYQVQFIHHETLPEPRPAGWLDVPETAVIKGPNGQPVVNPTGIPVAWWYGGVVRCFSMAGAI